MQLRWLGTAGFELRSDGGTVLLIDPYLSRPPSARPQSPIGLADILRADAILVTHGHFDHALDVPVLANRLEAPIYASATVCRILACHEVLRWRHAGSTELRRGTKPPVRTSPPAGNSPLAGTLPPTGNSPPAGTSLHPLEPGDSAQVGDLRIRALAARHVRFDLPLVLRTLPRVLPRLLALLPLLGIWPAGQVLGFHITAPNLSLVHFGSAGWVQGTLEGLHPDVALLPVQGRSDIAQVVTRMAILLQPHLVVPHHWDDFCPPISQLVSLTPFADALSHSLPAAQLYVPEIGQWFLENRNP